MPYVDGFVLAVPTAKRAGYEKMAREAVEMFKEFGATEIFECWGDDVPDGKLTSFPMAVKLEKDETVVFSWIKYPSREVRDAANVKMREDPRMSIYDPTTIPFDGKRMIYGGFNVLVEA